MKKTKDLEELGSLVKKEKKASKVKKTVIHVEAPTSDKTRIITIPRGLKIFRT